jgi:ferric-dicitrate binding protein FerR (iron transport regulator)
MTTKRPEAEDDAALEAAFAALRQAAPAPSPALQARVLADAAAAARPRAVRPPGWAARLAGWVRRHAVAGGLATAALAGFAVGTFVPMPALLDTGAAEVALIPDFEAFALLDLEDLP